MACWINRRSWIVKAKIEGRRNEEIADAMEVSVRRVQQLHSRYTKTGTIPTLKVGGRPRAPAITPEEMTIVREAYQKKVQALRVLPGESPSGRWHKD